MQVSASPHETAADAFQALSDRTRLRIFGLLLHAGELCGCEVEATLGISQTRASRALTALRRAGLVVDRRDGAWVHYAVDRRADPLLRALVQGLRRALAEDAVVRADVANLQRRCC